MRENIKMICTCRWDNPMSCLKHELEGNELLAYLSGQSEYNAETEQSFSDQKEREYEMERGKL